MSITKETRLESYIKTKVTGRQKKVLDALGDKEMTARMIAAELGYSDMNAVRPRITELKELGVIEACGKAYDQTTKRNVALFKRAM